MSKNHLRIMAIAILAVAAIFVIADAQTVLAQEEPLCTPNEENGCDYNGCEDTSGYCFKVFPSSPCACGYTPG